MRLLILSFSPIAADARVLKQVQLFAERYEVTTCGYGPAPDGVAAHIRIPDELPFDGPHGRLITARLYSAAYWRMPAVRWVRAALRGLRVDVALADDVEAVPLALTLPGGAPVHADLHEYSPRLHDELPAWDRRIRPWYEWLCRRYVARAASWTTVGAGIADEYERMFGFRAQVVTNASPLTDLAPAATGSVIRTVHSGACLRNRRLDLLIEAADSVPGVTLDLLLTPNDPAYLRELTEQAARSDGVRVLDPVPYADLLRALNHYDVGIHMLPPTNFNNANALPNKLFDYVQARLGLIVGPTPEMARIVRSNGIGVVTEGFGAADLRARLDRLTAAEVTAFKQASDRAARELSAESQVRIWAAAIDTLAEAAP